MATATTEATTVKATALDRAGAAVAVLSVIALAVPIIYTVYAANGNVTLKTSDDIQSLFTNGIIVTLAAAALGLIGAALTVPGLLKGARVGRIVTTLVSLIVLVASLVGLLVVIAPRASAVSDLKTKIQPFGQTLQQSCQTPLNNLSGHENDIFVHALQAKISGDAAGDALLVQTLQADLANLQQDATDLKAGSDKLSKLTAPSGPAYYAELLTHCQQDVAGQADFLTNDTGANAVTLPAPFSAIAPKAGLITLVKGSALVASGTSPLGHLPPGTVETVLAAAMQRVIAGSKDQVATDDGNKLQADIAKTLTDNLSPIAVDTNAVINGASK